MYYFDPIHKVSNSGEVLFLFRLFYSMLFTPLLLHTFTARGPQNSGWNNIRMAMETVIVFAHAMGRTIVLPPEANMYLLNDGLDFHDFFHLEAMAAKHDGMSIISMEVSWNFK